QVMKVVERRQARTVKPGAQGAALNRSAAGKANEAAATTTTFKCGLEHQLGEAQEDTAGLGMPRSRKSGEAAAELGPELERPRGAARRRVQVRGGESHGVWRGGQNQPSSTLARATSVT